MPCRDYMDYDNQGPRVETRTEYVDNPELKKRCDKLSAYLCALLTSIENNRGEIETNTLISRSKYPKDLKAWWINHKKQDLIHNKPFKKKK